MRSSILHGALIAVLASSTPMQSGTIRVPSDQPTIQAGIDAAVNLDAP